MTSSEPLRRWWRALYAPGLSLVGCPAGTLTLLAAVWAGCAAAINGFATLSGLLMTYFAARFGVLGVYVGGRTREKLAGTAESVPSLVEQLIKALGKKK